MTNKKSKYPITYRRMEEGDTGFIFSTWLKSYRNSEWAKSMSNDVFFSNHKEIVRKILANPNTTVTLICANDAPDQIYGYVVAEIVGASAIVHFLYVKYNFRKMGMMGELMEELGYLSTPDAQSNFITHLPRNYTTLKDKYSLEYCPYLLPNGETDED